MSFTVQYNSEMQWYQDQSIVSDKVLPVHASITLTISNPCEGHFNQIDKQHMCQDHSTGASCTNTLPIQGNFPDKILAIVHPLGSKLCKQLGMVYKLRHPRMHNHKASLLVHLLQQTANVLVAQLAMFGIDHIVPTDLLEQLPDFAHPISCSLLQPASFRLSTMMSVCWDEPLWLSAWSV